MKFILELDNHAVIGSETFSFEVQLSIKSALRPKLNLILISNLAVIARQLRFSSKDFVLKLLIVSIFDVSRWNVHWRP
jgi:hypothetical protein